MGDTGEGRGSLSFSLCLTVERQFLDPNLAQMNSVPPRARFCRNCALFSQFLLMQQKNKGGVFHICPICREE